MQSRAGACRPGSCAEFAADLQRWQEDRPILARRIGLRERFNRWCKRNPLVAGLTAAVLLVFVIGFTTSSAFAVLANRRAEAESTAKQEAIDAGKKLINALKKADQQVYISSVTLAGIKWNAGTINGLPELLAACPERHRHWEWYRMNYVIHGDLPTLRGHTNSVTDVVFSPDGRQIVSASVDNTLKIWDAANGRERQTLKGHTSTVRGVAFSPGGRRIVSASDDNTLKIWDAATGRELRTLKGHERLVSNIAFSPDGRRIASGSDDETVRIWDAGPDFKLPPKDDE